MGNKNNKYLPSNSSSLESPTSHYINKNAALLNGWNASGDTANILISIRFLRHEFECFSDWNKEEMKSFWLFIKKAHEYTWQNLKDQSCKGKNKNGLGFTSISVSKYPKKYRENFDPQSNLFELRVNQKARVHCFRDKSVCYIIVLDKDHKVFPQ